LLPGACLPDTIAPVRSTLYLFLLRPSLPHVLSRTPWLPLLPSSTTWHHHLGHPNPNVISKLSSSSTITYPQSRDDSLCRACQLGRHVWLPFSSSFTRAIQPPDLVHYDLWTSPVPSVSGYKYYLVILDDCTHYSWTFPLRQKSDNFPTLSHFFAFVFTQFGRTIWSVQCNNECEFDNSIRTFFLSRRPASDVVPYTSP
jgi:hypothetical protein